MTLVNINQLIKRSQRRRLPVPDDRRGIRIAAGISQAELGDALGVSRASVARWENGSRDPSRKFAGSYADALRRMQEDAAS